MISAIAARKAAQQRQEQQETTPQRLPSLSPPPLSPPPRSPKRKPSAQRSKPPSKRQKNDINQKQNASSPPTPKSDVFRAQDDVIIIESDDDDDVEPISQNLSGDSDIEMLSAPPAHPVKRAWSPSRPLDDSSDEDDTTVDVSELIDIPVRLSRLPDTNIGVTLSTFVPVPSQNIYYLSTSDVAKMGLQLEEKGTVVVLEPGQKLCILGTCRLTLLKGAFAINGTMLRPSTKSHNVFAPRSSPLPILEGRAGSKVAIDASLLPHVIQAHVQPQSALVLLQELRSNVEGLGRVCRIFDGVYELSGWQDEWISAPFQLDGIYLVKKQTRDTAPFILPPTWSKALPPSPSSLPNNPIYLIKGPKKCGKSSFARTLLNTLLSSYARVAYIDCDLGQSEFTPGGMVTLNVISHSTFGPPYTHLTVPLRAHFVGATTPRSTPSWYLDAVRDLVEVWRVDVQHAPVGEGECDDEGIGETTPLIVNTMGWVKGLGADLMQKIEEMVEPGQIFEFQTDESVSSMPSLHSPPPRDTTNVHILEPAPLSILSTNYTPADHRTISLLSYFYATFSPPAPPSRFTDVNQTFEQVTACGWDTTHPLCAIPPYEVDIHAAFDQIVLTGAGSEDVVPEELGRVLNGALIGFVKLDHHQHPLSSPEGTGDKILPYIQGQAPPPPSESSCIGLGLVRGVSFVNSSDCSSAVLHILTPIPLTHLSSARIIVKGEMELPIWGMLDFSSASDAGGVAGVEKGNVPYLQWGRASDGAIGAERRRVRRNLMRRGQA
ncbi:hypothetical protein P691DRAFT_738484 [Macrolepiota fuliginosa MF-IS2]|uniref:Polynucleotide 5'-hydroxyl-kinase GRC3 n=1 Tax=Macrolepiota fuliginosa MF-IS2 TaxID=1400762 RepID=A0A9P5X258_9AGAR|nr:hypothetical protein P691DRAFT_738484 [Macrolepiota fuliginosa MF-IS2]